MSKNVSPKSVLESHAQSTPARRDRFSLANLSIKHRLPLLIGLPLSVIIVISTWAAYRGVRASVLAVGRERLLRQTEQLANLSQQSFVIQGRRTFSAANDSALQAYLRAPSPATRPGAVAILEQFTGPQDPNGIQVELWSADHTLALAAPDGSTPLQSDLEAEFKQCATEPFRAAGKIRLVKDTLAAPVVAMARNEAGKPSGYLVRWRKLAYIPEASKQLTDLLGSQVAFYYGNNQGDLWTDLLKVLPPPPVDLRSTPNVTHYTRDGNPVMALARPINGTPWFVVVEFREQVFLSQSTAFLRVLGLISLVLFAFGVAAAFALSRNITRPLHSLTKAASAISGGDYSRLVGIRQNDELGKLAEAFDAMVIKLRDSQRELERQVQEKTLLLEAAPSAMLGVDKRGRIVLANNQAERLFGYTQDELSEQPIEILIPERFRVTHADHRAGFFQQPSSRPMGAGRDLYGVRKDGSEFPVEIGLNPLATERGMMVLSTTVDITERKRAEEKLREQAAMLNQAREAILVREMDGGIRFWNRGAERLYGWRAEEVLDRPVSELLYGGDSSELDKAVKTVVEKGEWSGEIRQFTKDGRELTVEAHWTLIRDEQGRPKSVLAINTDITEKKKLEAQFLRGQRLESLGTLAGGIAHDLNNILSPVLMGVQMLQMKFTDAGEQRLLEVMRGNVERGAEMIKQILLFTRGVQGERVPLQPKQIIKETVKIIGETFPKSIEIKFSIPEELALVSGDATQLQQVLMNLCVNARDAMPHGGRLLIEAVNTTMDEQQVAFAPDARPGQYVQLLISDTGTGIPEEVKDKIFDPFFTTKELGKGTGLGLSTALGIVKSHNGFINVYSEAGQGTKFTVYLPAHTAGRTAQLAAKQVEMPAGRGELILVVDDEASVREITGATLESFGYRVLLASDGTEALALYAQHGSEIQAVLTDAMMPYMDGPATIRALQQFSRQIKVIASSGLAEQERVNEMAALGVSHFLPKPYTADRLLKLLAKALQGD